MLEAGSNPRVRNKGGLTAYQLVDPSNVELRDVIRRSEFASQNVGDYVNVVEEPKGGGSKKKAKAVVEAEPESDEDAEFSGSDDEERAEWERRRKERQRRG